MAFSEKTNQIFLYVVSESAPGIRVVNLELTKPPTASAAVADRLQRYEGSLERAFDRTLAQLERLQRMRLGQPVAPPLKVQLSA